MLLSLSLSAGARKKRKEQKTTPFGTRISILVIYRTQTAGAVLTSSCFICWCHEFGQELLLVCFLLLPYLAECMQAGIGMQEEAMDTVVAWLSTKCVSTVKFLL